MWVLGLPQPTIKSITPTLGDVLRVVAFHHTFKQEKLAWSFLEVADQLFINAENSGQVPMLRRNIVKKIERKYKLYCSLRKSKNRQSNEHRVEDFSRSLGDIFDVVRVNDKVSISLSKPCCSTSLAEPAAAESVGDSLPEDYYSLTDVEDDCDVDDDFAADLSKFHRQKISTSSTPIKINLIDVILRSRDVISMADRINLSDRKLLMLVAAIARATGENIDDSTFSRGSLQKLRNNYRSELACAIEDDFRTRERVPLTVHWDGKIINDFGTDENTCLKSERHAVVVTGLNVEKILGIPPIESGTGWTQAKV